MLCLQPLDGDFLLPVKVVPGASRERIAGWHGEGIKVTVTAIAEKGAANAAVVQLLAKSLELPPHQVSIARGLTSPHKQVRIAGLGSAELTARLKTLLG